MWAAILAFKLLGVEMKQIKTAKWKTLKTKLMFSEIVVCCHLYISGVVIKKKLIFCETTK